MMVPVVMAMASAATSNYKIPFNGRHQVLDLAKKIENNVLTGQLFN